jgi:hypothetical protein
MTALTVPLQLEPSMLSFNKNRRYYLEPPVMYKMEIVGIENILLTGETGWPKRLEMCHYIYYNCA